MRDERGVARDQWSGRKGTVAGHSQTAREKTSHDTERQDHGERAEQAGLCVNGLGLGNGHRLFEGDPPGDFISVTGTVGIEADTIVHTEYNEHT